jgi:arginine utilization regulatory protein
MAEGLKEKFESIANFTVENNLSFREVIEELEKNLIKAALKKTNYNKKKAAELLNIHRNTFNIKVKKYKIKRNLK